jgi:hypothetical protein
VQSSNRFSRPPTNISYKHPHTENRQPKAPQPAETSRPTKDLEPCTVTYQEQLISFQGSLQVLRSDQHWTKPPCAVHVTDLQRRSRSFLWS